MYPRLAVKTLQTIALLAICIGILLGSPHVVHASSPHDPILINGDNQFTSDNGVTAGSGTTDDPYIIEGWTINASSAPGIVVENTNVYFTIRDVSIQSPSQTIPYNGTVFVSDTHARLENSQIQVGPSSQGQPLPAAVWVSLASDVTLKGNNIQSGGYDVVLSASDSITIDNNVVSGGPFGIVGDSFSELTITGNVIGAEDPISLARFSTATIADNVIQESSGGTALTNCDTVTVHNNIMGRHEDSLSIANCDNVSVFQNSFPGQCPRIGFPCNYDHAITLANVGGVSIEDNNITFAAIGIWLYPDATGNQIIGNNLAQNGCGVSGSQDTLNQNTFEENTFTSNTHDYCVS